MGKANKQKPAAPAIGKTPQVLPCDKSEPLWESYKGCHECSSLLHRKEDHGKGGKGKGGKTQKSCKNCGRTNHWTDQCRNVKCAHCGGGHWAAECDSKTKPEAAAQKKEPKENKNSEVDEYSVVAVKGEVNGKEAVIGLDTFCGVEALVAQSLVEGEALLESQTTLEGVGADTVALGAKQLHVVLDGGTHMVVKADVLKNLPGQVDLLIGGKPLEEHGLTLQGGEVHVGQRKCERVFVAAAKKKEEKRRKSARGAKHRRSASPA